MGTSPGSQESELFERLSKCVLCSVDFVEHRVELESAKFLECFHSVCGTCVNLWPNNVSRKCPECNFSSCKKNLLEAKIIQERMAQGEKVCGKDPLKEAVRWCKDCKQLVCQECVDNHKRLKSTQDHIMKPPEDPEAATSKVFRCPEHPQELLRIYCYTCGKLKCRDCQFTENNISHKIAFVEIIVNKDKTEINEMKKILGHQLIEINESLKIYSNTQNKMKNDYKSIRKQIIKDAETLVNEIERQKLKALKILDLNYRQKESEFNNIRSKYDLRSKILSHSVQFTSAVLTDLSDMSIYHCLNNLKKWLEEVQLRKMQHRFLPNPFFELVYKSDVEKIKNCIGVLGTVSCNKIDTDPAIEDNPGFCLTGAPLSPPASIDTANEMSENEGVGDEEMAIEVNQGVCVNLLSPESYEKIDVVGVDEELDQESSKIDNIAENSVPETVPEPIPKQKNILMKVGVNEELHDQGSSKIDKIAENSAPETVPEPIPKQKNILMKVGVNEERHDQESSKIDNIAENSAPETVPEPIPKQKNTLMKVGVNEERHDQESSKIDNIAENSAPETVPEPIPKQKNILMNENETVETNNTVDNENAPIRAPETSLVQASAEEKKKMAAVERLPELSAQDVEKELRPRINVRHISALQAPVEERETPIKLFWYPPLKPRPTNYNKFNNEGALAQLERNFGSGGRARRASQSQGSYRQQPYNRGCNQGNPKDQNPPLYYSGVPQFSTPAQIGPPLVQVQYIRTASPSLPISSRLHTDQPVPQFSTPAQIGPLLVRGQYIPPAASPSLPISSRLHTDQPVPQVSTPAQIGPPLVRGQCIPTANPSPPISSRLHIDLPEPQFSTPAQIGPPLVRGQCIPTANPSPPISSRLHIDLPEPQFSTPAQIGPPLVRGQCIPTANPSPPISSRLHIDLPEPQFSTPAQIEPPLVRGQIIPTASPSPPISSRLHTNQPTMKPLHHVPSAEEKMLALQRNQVHFTPSNTIQTPISSSLLITTISPVNGQPAHLSAQFLTSTSMLDSESDVTNVAATIRENQVSSSKQTTESLPSPVLTTKKRRAYESHSKKKKDHSSSSSTSPTKRRRSSDQTLPFLIDMFNAPPKDTNKKIHKSKEKLTPDSKKHNIKVNPILVKIPLDMNFDKKAIKSPQKNKKEDKKKKKNSEKEHSKTTSPDKIVLVSNCEICLRSKSDLNCNSCSRVYHMRCLRFGFSNYSFHRTQSASVSIHLNECILCEDIEKLRVVDSKMDDLSRKVCVRVFLEILIHPKCRSFFSDLDKEGNEHKKEIMRKFEKDKFKQGIIEFVTDLKKMFVNCFNASAVKDDNKEILLICTRILKRFLPDNCLNLFKFNIK